MTARFTGLVVAGDVPEGYDPAANIFAPLWGNSAIVRSGVEDGVVGQLWERLAERDHREGLWTTEAWLAGSVEGCTCGMEGTYYQHEPYCGVEPIRRISEFPSRTAVREGDIPLTTHGIIHGKRAQ